jgi:hypothetical protein
MGKGKLKDLIKLGAFSSYLWEWAIASHAKGSRPFFGSGRSVGQLALCFNRLLVGVGHCFAWQGYSSLLAIGNEIITGVRGLAGVGLNTGIPRVGFSHTVPVPANTVPVPGTYRYRPVNGTVPYETRGILIIKFTIKFTITTNYKGREGGNTMRRLLPLIPTCTR